LTGSLTRGGRLLGDEKIIVRRGCFDAARIFCDGVPGSSGRSLSLGSSTSISSLAVEPFLTDTGRFGLRFGDAERRFG